MAGILKKLTKLAQIAGLYLLQYFHIALAWTNRLFKVQGQKCGKCCARKNMEKTASRLGQEIYGLHKQGETEWSKNSIVEQQLKLVEEAESRIFLVDETVENINNEYLKRKQEIIDEYTARRAQVDKQVDKEENETEE